LPRLILMTFLLGGLALAQMPPVPDPPSQPPERKAPDGRNLNEQLLKEDYKANLKDLAEMQKMLAAVQADMEKNNQHVLSLVSLRYLEEIEKLSKRVRGRMKRF
jgi:hypothetical protein